MKSLKLTSFFFLALLFIVASCKKEDSAANEETCRVTKEYAYNESGVVDDSATFTYTGTQITKVTLADYNYTLEYSGDKVSRRNYFENGSSSVDYSDAVTYNADGTINKVEYFERSGSANVLYGRVTFEYEAGKLVKDITYEIENNVATKVLENFFTYTGNNITQVRAVDYITPATGTFIISYDSNKNYFKKWGTNFFLIDHFFGDASGINNAIVLSENNVVSIALTGQSGSTSLTYTADTEGNLTMLSIRGKTALAYSFQCQ